MFTSPPYEYPNLQREGMRHRVWRPTEHTRARESEELEEGPGEGGGPAMWPLSWVSEVSKQGSLRTVCAQGLLLPCGFAQQGAQEPLCDSGNSDSRALLLPKL